MLSRGHKVIPFEDVYKFEDVYCVVKIRIEIGWTLIARQGCPFRTGCVISLLTRTLPVNVLSDFGYLFFFLSSLSKPLLLLISLWSCNYVRSRAIVAHLTNSAVLHPSQELSFRDLWTQFLVGGIISGNITSSRFHEPLRMKAKGLTIFIYRIKCMRYVLYACSMAACQHSSQEALAFL